MLAAVSNHPRGSPRSRMSLFLAPFDRGKMRQFELVWLQSQSSCVLQPVHRTPVKYVAQYAHLYLPFMEFCLARRGSWWPPVYRSCFQVWSLSKTQATCVYRHSGPFIHKLAVLIQLQESSWTIQQWNAATPEKGQQEVVYRVPPVGGARRRRCCWMSLD